MVPSPLFSEKRSLDCGHAKPLVAKVGAATIVSRLMWQFTKRIANNQNALFITSFPWWVPSVPLVDPELYHRNFGLRYAFVTLLVNVCLLYGCFSCKKEFGMFVHRRVLICVAFMHTFIRLKRILRKNKNKCFVLTPHPPLPQQFGHARTHAGSAFLLQGANTYTSRLILNSKRVRSK